MRKRAVRPPGDGAGAFGCFCGRSFDQPDALIRHKIRAGCERIFDEDARKTMQQQKTADGVQPDEAAEEMRKRVRVEAEFDERQRRVALQLADLCYIKLVAGTHVDAMKAMHKKLVRDSLKAIEQHVDRLLADVVEDKVVSEIKELLHGEFDFYKGLQTEYQERKYLESFLPSPKVFPRQLPHGGTAYDFKLDEQLLLLLKHSTAAREQFYETIASFRTVHPWTRDNPKRIIVDIMDSDSARDHTVFGDGQRMTREQAELAALSGPFRFAIWLWQDGFVVGLPPI